MVRAERRPPRIRDRWRSWPARCLSTPMPAKCCLTRDNRPGFDGCGHRAGSDLDARLDLTAEHRECHLVDRARHDPYDLVTIGDLGAGLERLGGSQPPEQPVHVAPRVDAAHE